ncbi:MAG: phosphopantetheine-binding protein, partial [Pseudonocardia sediminis]
MTGNPVVVTAGPLRGHSTDDHVVDPDTNEEVALAAIIADVLNVERVSVMGHFFDDLGADSMVMARFCARVRKNDTLPPVSMKDVYRNPTIRGLASSLAPAVVPDPSGTAPVPGPPAESGTAAVVRRATTREYVLCGALQLLAFLGYIYLLALVTTAAYEWVSAGSGLLDHYVRSVVVGAVALVVLGLLPIVVKWTLIGRWKPVAIRIWSLAYFRFWLVKTLIRTNPLVLLAVGSPIYPLYLRALGARVGRGVVILSKSVPVCTDLLTVGDGTVIRKDALVSGYRAHAGAIETGPVTLGSDVFVGEATVIDIGTVMGDGAQLGHSSSLHTGQSVPDGQSVHGTPAQPTDVDHRGVGPAPCGTRRRLVYGLMQLVTALLLYLPLVVGGIDILLARFPQLTGALTTGALDTASPVFYLDALGVSFALFAGAIVAGLVL